MFRVLKDFRTSHCVFVGTNKSEVFIALYSKVPSQQPAASWFKTDFSHFSLTKQSIDKHMSQMTILIKLLFFYPHAVSTVTAFLASKLFYSFSHPISPHLNSVWRRDGIICGMCRVAPRCRLLNSISAPLCGGSPHRKLGLVRRSPTAVIHMATLFLTHQCHSREQ